MNESSLLAEEQEAGPVLTPSEILYRDAKSGTQNKPSYTDRAGQVGIIGPGHVDTMSQMGTHVYLSQPQLRERALFCKILALWPEMSTW